VWGSRSDTIAVPWIGVWRWSGAPTAAFSTACRSAYEAINCECVQSSISRVCARSGARCGPRGVWTVRAMQHAACRSEAHFKQTDSDIIIRVVIESSMKHVPCPVSAASCALCPRQPADQLLQAITKTLREHRTSARVRELHPAEMCRVRESLLSRVPSFRCIAQG
jgi:hypothetical protein